MTSFFILCCCFYVNLISFFILCCNKSILWWFFVCVIVFSFGLEWVRVCVWVSFTEVDKVLLFLLVFKFDLNCCLARIISEINLLLVLLALAWYTDHWLCHTPYCFCFSFYVCAFSSFRFKVFSSYKFFFLFNSMYCPLGYFQFILILYNCYVP